MHGQRNLTGSCRALGMKRRFLNRRNVRDHEVLYDVTAPPRLIIETFRETLGSTRLMIHRLTVFAFPLTLTKLVPIDHVETVGPAVMRVLYLWIGIVALGFKGRLIAAQGGASTLLMLLAEQ